MKKTIGIIISLSIILTGCSSGKKDVDTTTQNAPASNTQVSQSENTAKTTDQTTAKNTAENKTKNTSQNVKVAKGNTSSSSVKNMDTSKSQFKNGYYDYKGTINNNIPIRLSIYPLKKEIVGTYLYEKQKKEIKLQGKAGEKNIILYEYDETGKNTGKFEGTMNTVDKIEGTWTSADSKHNYHFILSLKSNLPGVEYGKRYAVAVGTMSDKSVENFVSEIQSNIIKGNREWVAEQVAYPISVKINGKVKKIQNKDEFVKNYDLIFSSKYKQVISNELTRYMFANYKGIMFGGDQYNMWINNVIPNNGTAKLKIITINN